METPHPGLDFPGMGFNDADQLVGGQHHPTSRNWGNGVHKTNRGCTSHTIARVLGGHQDDCSESALSPVIPKASAEPSSGSKSYHHQAQKTS